LCTNYANLPIRLIRQKNSGAPAARNRGFAESSGQYVIFWDADVVAEPDMLAKMLQALESNKTAAYAYCNFYMGYKKMKAQEYSLPSLQTCNFICTMSLLRREAFPGFDESLRRFQDWDLWLTIAERGGSGVWVPEFLFRIIQHGGSMSSWLPSFAYKSPWKYLPIIRGQVRRYHEAEQVVRQKHFLI
jgi:glycosyltransferase involved in cell wall biosynthesis